MVIPLKPTMWPAYSLRTSRSAGWYSSTPSRARGENSSPMTSASPSTPSWVRTSVAVVVAAVPIAHQETDQALVGLVHLLLAPREADPRRVHDREVGRHGVVEPDEAVVEDADGVLGYDFGVTAMTASLPGPYVGTSGFSYASWRGGFYPADAKPKEFLRRFGERLRPSS